MFTDRNYANIRSRAHHYDVASDGQRLLVISGSDDVNAATSRQINVVLNWFEELKRLVPVK